jgi:hypothetical protein
MLPLRVVIDALKLSRWKSENEFEEEKERERGEKERKRDKSVYEFEKSGELNTRWGLKERGKGREGERERGKERERKMQLLEWDDAFLLLEARRSFQRTKKTSKSSIKKA